MPVLALIQCAMSVDSEANLRRASALVEEAAGRGADLICLPELFRTRYFPQTEDARNFELAEPADGPSVTAMTELARRCGVALVVPFFERRAPGLYHNSLVVLDARGERIAKYRKLHIPDDPCFYEKYYFTLGDLGFQVAECQLRDSESLWVGTLICWDQWFPEAARLTALAGAQLIVYPTAIGWHDSEPPAVRAAQLDAWLTIQRSHAIANGVFVAAANRVGREDALMFWGSSFVVSPAGEVIARASADEETVLLAELDLAHIAEQRHGWPFLRDRRVDVYAGLEQRMKDQ